MDSSATGLTLRTHEGRPYRFDPGALSLELLPTGGPGRFAVFEVLRTPADLVRWAGESRLPAGIEPVVTVEEVEAARAFRNALFRLIRARAHGQSPGPDAVGAVNHAATLAPLTPQLAPDGSRTWAPDATGTQILSTVARDAIDLLTGPYADRIRECATSDCSLLFVDTSRPGKRRWCAMEHCGNLHKVRTHRTRTKEKDRKEASMGPTGLTKDAGWQIGVSRTLDAPIEEVWSLLESPRGIELWLGPGARPSPEPVTKGSLYRTDDGTTGEVRSVRSRDRMRATHGSTTVQVAITPASGGRTVLRFHQDRMSSAAEREAQRTHWQKVMDTVEKALHLV